MGRISNVLHYKPVKLAQGYHAVAEGEDFMARNKKQNFRSHLMSEALLGACLAVPLLSGGAIAQETDEEVTRTRDVITVSATKREQTLQETPVAVSVIGAETIERAEIQDLSDLATLVPSLRVAQGSTAGNTNYYIRGFGNGSNAIGVEPSVAVFVDGVYRSRSSASVSDLPNLERVEVLRGPQTTLFGKNASAGVISLITRRPQFETMGNIEVSVGNYDSRRLAADITGPLTENLAYSLSGSLNQRGGYAEDLGTGEDYNQRNRWGVRGDLLFLANNDLEFRLIADYDEIDEICCIGTNLVNGPVGGVVMALGGQFVPEDPFSYQTYSSFAPTNEIVNSGISLQADYDLGFATLTSISARRRNESTTNFDPDFSSLDIFGQNLESFDIETFTHELRLTSNENDSRLAWLLGFYYFDESVAVENALTFGQDWRPLVSALAGGPTVLTSLESLVGVPQGTFAAAGQGTNEDMFQDNTAWNVFGTVDFNVTERLTATFGLNYTEDNKDVRINIENTDALSALNIDQLGYTATLAQLLARQGVNIADPRSVGPFIQMNPALYRQLQQSALDIAQSDNNPLSALRGVQILPPVLGFPNAVETGESNDSNTSVSFRLVYDVSDNINVYASYATGFKPTSWNLSRQTRPFASDFTTGNTIIDPVTRQPVFIPPSSPINDAGLNITNLRSGTRYAAPEESQVYELGIRGDFDTVQFSLTFFDQSIENFQTIVWTGDGFAFANAEEQSSTGLEIDLTWQPIDPLTLTFAGTFMDSVYDTFTNFGDGVDVSGQTPVGVADTQWSISGNYNFLVARMPAFVRADWQYVGSSPFFNDPDEVALMDGSGYTREQSIVNASAGLMTPAGIGISVWGRNLFDDESIVGAFPTLAQEGSISGFPNQPRTYGVTVRRTF
ncbi:MULTISPECIES: TonB-dependent receptor [Hyphobacterium]|uniref:TonB-dependent receptor n=1 Tax=Hyphobacterium vulgare TaxID=1736751 RepID=A0ABV7A112_9PROT